MSLRSKAGSIASTATPLALRRELSLMKQVSTVPSPPSAPPPPPPSPPLNHHNRQGHSPPFSCFPNSHIPQHPHHDCFLHPTSPRRCCIIRRTDHHPPAIAQRMADSLGVRLSTQRMNEKSLVENFEDAVFASEHCNPDLNSVGKFVLSNLPREEGFKVVLSGQCGSFCQLFSTHKMQAKDLTSILGDIRPSFPTFFANQI